MILSLRRFSKKYKARQAYKAAKEAYDDAVSRKDTRDQHVTEAEMRKAMANLLKAEAVRVVR